MSELVTPVLEFDTVLRLGFGLSQDSRGLPGTTRSYSFRMLGGGTGPE